MSKIVWTLIATLLVFVTVVVVCNINAIQIQDSLITGFIAVLSAELATMGGIQITKVRHKKKGDGGNEQDQLGSETIEP